MAETVFHTLLRKKTEEEVELKSSSLVNGDASDYSRYMYNVGYIAGLRAALNLCDEIESEFDK